MTKKILIISLILFLSACDKDKDNETPIPSKTELLTAGSQKDWYIFSSTPESPCPSSVDDTWTFFADGQFEFDHGTVTEDEGEECGDFVNLEGTWEFSSDEKNITIVALRAKGSTEDFDTPVTIGSGVITELTEGRMVVTSPDGEESYELRPR